MRAIWRGVTIAESDKTIVVEDNHYFPREAIRSEYFRDSSNHTRCSWKGIASYFDVVVNGEINRDAAWYYPEPTEAASKIRNRVAFWKGVEVVS